MKNINLCHLTLVFFSFLFSHSSYSINYSTELSNLPNVVTAATENSYCTSNSNLLSGVIKHSYTKAGYNNVFLYGSLPSTILTIEVTDGGTDPIDPDWRKLVAHIFLL